MRRKLKYLAKIVSGQAPSGESVSDSGKIPFLQGCAEFGAVSPKADKYCDAPSKLAPKSSILVSVRAPVGRMNIADQRYGIGRGLAAIAARSSVNKAFLSYAVESAVPELQSWSTGSTYDAVSGSDIGNLSIPLPDLPTQKAIADFLDRETARINQLIERKQRMVEVLGEKLAAQLQYTVLAGAKLSRNPEGDWLSDLSNDWRLFPIKHMVRIVGGATPSKEREDYWIGPIPWVSPKDMKRDTISATSHCISEMALANSPVSIVPKGAVLIVVRGMILARLVPVCRLGCNATINQDMKALTSRGNIISNHYLHRMLQGFQDVIMSFVDEAAHGTKTLRSDRFFSLKFPVPPFELQTNLVVEYDKQKRLMDAIIEKIESSIYRLREFRPALITAAVTGQIDVSTWGKQGTIDRRLDQIEEAASA